MLAAATVLLSSCVVSKKKFEIAEAGRLAALYSRDSLAELLGISRYDCSVFNDRVNALMTDTALLKGSIRNYQSLLASGQSENQKLNANLQDREKTIAELQRMIAQQNQKVKDLLTGEEVRMQDIFVSAGGFRWLLCDFDRENDGEETEAAHE